jgi:HEAT repeat protein
VKRHFANPHKDRRSVKTLFQVAISEFENQKAWNAIRSLQRRGTRDIFDSARKLCASSIAKEREVGVNVLAQIGARAGGRKPVFLRQSVDLLIERLQDRSIYVISAAAVGLGHRDDPRAIPYLIALKDHPNSIVRDGISFGLARHEHPLAIKALIKLSRDKDRDTRDYAVFGLGELINRNTKAIRDALFARLKEHDVEIRGQALIGLVKRKDPRVWKPLRKELRQRYNGDWCLVAAEEARNPKLYSLLMEMRRRWKLADDHWHTKQLNDAIAACEPKKKRKAKR